MFAVTAILAGAIIFLTAYFTAYNDMIFSLQERMDSICKHLEENLDKSAAKTGEEVLCLMCGDELVVLLREATEESVRFFAERVAAEFKAVANRALPENAFSFGYASCPSNSVEDFEAAYNAADAGMYQDKRALKALTGEKT